MQTREEREAELFAPWMAVAHRYDGLRELDDAGELTKAVRDMFLNTRFPLALVNKKTAWCSAFACTVLECSGIAHPRSARARDFLTSPHFIKLRSPIYGALLVFERNAPGGDAHVGFCDRELASPVQLDVLTFGGNQDNAACSRRRKLELLIDSLWPKGWPLPPGALTV